MSTIIEYDIKVNNQSAKKNLEAIGGDINGIKDSIDALTEALGKSVEQISKIGTESDALEEVEQKAQDATKAVKNTGKAAKGTSTGINAIGLAFKAIGIGMVVALLAKLGDAFTRNQKVADFLANATETLSIALSDFVNFATDSTKIVSFMTTEFKKFANLIKAVVLNNISNLVNSLGLLGTTITKLFSGDIKGAVESAKSFGTSIKEGVIDSITGASLVFNYATVAITNYAKQTYNAAKANVELANSAKLAVAELGKQLAISDIAAEKQRQVRDDETESFEKRLAASEALRLELDNREKIVNQLANAEIAVAQAELDKNNNIENQVALIEAQTKKTEALAGIEGQRSEQITSEISLRKEKTTTEEEQLAKELELKRSSAELDRELDLELQELNAETQAEIFEAKRAAIREEQIKLLEDESLTEQQRVMIKKISEAKIANLEKQAKDLSQSNEKESQKFTVGIASQTASTLAGVLGEETAAGKAASIASTTIDTYSSAISAFSSLSGIPVVGPALGAVAAAAAVASGIATVKKIASTKTPGNKSVGTPSLSTPSFANATPSISSTRTVATPSFDNIQSVSPNTTSNTTVRAYVVQGDVTDAVEGDAKINTRRSF